MGELKRRKIYCCGCERRVKAVLISSAELYPGWAKRPDGNYWRCPACGNHVGCHREDGKGGTTPLGVIGTAEIRKAREKLHDALDPIWQTGLVRRKRLYRNLAKRLGVREFHIGWLRSMDDVREAMECISSEFARIAA